MWKNYEKCLECLKKVFINSSFNHISHHYRLQHKIKINHPVGGGSTSIGQTVFHLIIMIIMKKIITTIKL